MNEENRCITNKGTMAKNEWLEATTGGVLQEKVFLETLQNSQESTCAFEKRTLA